MDDIVFKHWQAFQKKMEQPLIGLKTAFANRDFEAVDVFFHHLKMENEQYMHHLYQSSRHNGSYNSYPEKKSVSYITMLGWIISVDAQFFDIPLQNDFSELFDFNFNLYEDKNINGSTHYYQQKNVSVNPYRSEHYLRDKRACYLSVFKHFETSFQLHIISQAIERGESIDIDYFQFIWGKSISHTAQATSFFNTEAWACIISRLFNTEQFDLLDDIGRQFSCHLVEQASEHIYFYRSVASEHVSFYRSVDKRNSHGNNSHTLQNYQQLIQVKLQLEQVVFKPYYHLMFNYSDAKRDYLFGHGIGEDIGVMDDNESFSLDCIYQLENTLHSLPDARFERLPFYSVLKNALNQYKKRLHYYKLSCAIESNLAQANSNNHNNSDFSDIQKSTDLDNGIGKLKI